MKLAEASKPPPSTAQPLPVPPSRKATVEDAEDDEMDGSFAPGGDADYFTEEDDEGRFFGGGLTLEQKDILNIFEKAGEDISEVRFWFSSEGFDSNTARGTIDKRNINNSNTQTPPFF